VSAGQGEEISSKQISSPCPLWKGDKLCVKRRGISCVPKKNRKDGGKN